MATARFLSINSAVAAGRRFANELAAFQQSFVKEVDARTTMPKSMQTTSMILGIGQW
jgi:hypothetical protein